MKQQHVSRAGRKAQIVMAVFEKYQTDVNPFMTTYAIAKAIGLAPSSHVKKIVNELVDQGWLNAKKQEDLFGRGSVIHWPTNEARDLMEETYVKLGAKFEIVKGWFEQ